MRSEQEEVWQWKNVRQTQNKKLSTTLVNYSFAFSKNMVFIKSKQIRSYLVSHQLSLDISLFFLHSLVFFLSLHWVMSWSNTHEKGSMVLSLLSCSSSGGQHINSNMQVIAVGCDFCSRCWWSALCGPKMTGIKVFIFLCYREDLDSTETLMPVLTSLPYRSLP